MSPVDNNNRYVFWYEHFVDDTWVNDLNEIMHLLDTTTCVIYDRKETQFYLQKNKKGVGWKNHASRAVFDFMPLSKENQEHLSSYIEPLKKAAEKANIPLDINPEKKPVPLSLLLQSLQIPPFSG